MGACAGDARARGRALGVAPARSPRSLASSTMPRPGLRRAASALAADDSFEVTVNGVPTRVPKGASVMAACDAAGVDIPR